MKNSITFFAAALLIVFCNLSLKAQNTFPASGAAGIGTTTPASSSLLEVKSTTKGVLIPRMTKTQRDAIVSPVDGLLVYQTNSTPGFYYYDGSAWKAVSQVKKDLSNLGTTAINSSLLPNATGTLDLGSTSQRWKDAYINNIKFSDGTTLSTASGGGGGSIGGSGTANYLPKFTGATTLGNSLIQDNGTNLWIGNYGLSPRAKLDIYNTTTIRGLWVETSLAGTAQQEGIHNSLSGTGTGTKYGINNSVSQTFSGTGDIYGQYNYMENYGGGTGYGTRTYMDILGSGTNYGNYTQMTSGVSSTLYGHYKALSSTGDVYGDYTTLSGSGTVFGQYITIPSVSGSNAKFGLYVNIPSTAGANYGIYSTVSSSNSNSYAASLNGKVYCSGNVGIGTISPSAKLHVDGGTDASASAGGYIVVGSTSSTNIAIDGNEIMARNNGAVSKLYLNNDGGDVSMCYAGGNVMIGASVPATGYLLSVDGKIIAEELKVQLSQNWPDYVFDEEYTMPSINDLKTFVNANKHLPGIPSASEMKENGISVGEMQTKMMQKIEELSLYIIQLQGQIDELKQVK